MGRPDCPCGKYSHRYFHPFQKINMAIVQHGCHKNDHHQKVWEENFLAFAEGGSMMTTELKGSMSSFVSSVLYHHQNYHICQNHHNYHCHHQCHYVNEGRWCWKVLFS